MKGVNEMIPDQLRCSECGATFNTPAELENHNRTVHSRFICATCGQMFDSEEALDAHNREMHPEKQQGPTK